MSSATLPSIFQDVKPSPVTTRLVSSTIVPSTSFHIDTTMRRNTSTNIGNTNALYGRSLYIAAPTATSALLPPADIHPPFSQTSLPFDRYGGLGFFSASSTKGEASHPNTDVGGPDHPSSLEAAMRSLMIRANGDLKSLANDSPKLRTTWRCLAPRHRVSSTTGVQNNSSNPSTPPRSASSTSTSFTFASNSSPPSSAASSFFPPNSFLSKNDSSNIQSTPSLFQAQQQPLAQLNHRNGAMPASSLGPLFIANANVNNRNQSSGNVHGANHTYAHTNFKRGQPTDASMYLPRTPAPMQVAPRHQSHAMPGRPQMLYATPTVAASTMSTGASRLGPICAEDGWVGLETGTDAFIGGATGLSARDFGGQVARSDRHFAPSYNVRQPTPSFLGASNMIAPRPARPIGLAPTYMNTYNHVITTSSPVARNNSNYNRSIRPEYIKKSPEYDPSVYPAEPSGIRDLLPTGAFLAPSGQRISTSGRVVNVSGDHKNEIMMYWPHNEPLPNNNQCKPTPAQHIARLHTLGRLVLNSTDLAFYELPPPPCTSGPARNHQQQRHLLISLAQYLELPKADNGQTLPPPEAMAKVLPAIKNTGNQGPMERQAFDWECGECHYVNWRRRLVCQLCYPYAPGNTPPATYAERMWTIVRIAAENVVRGTPIPATHRDYRIGEGRINPVAAGRKLQMEQQQQIVKELEALNSLLTLTQSQSRYHSHTSPGGGGGGPSVPPFQAQPSLGQPSAAASRSPLTVRTSSLTPSSTSDGRKVWGGCGVGNGVITITPASSNGSSPSPATSSHSPDWSKIGVIAPTARNRVSSSTSSSLSSSGSGSSSSSALFSSASLSSSAASFSRAPGSGVIRAARMGVDSEETGGDVTLTLC
ncbi:hypothetical protein FRB97_006442 [Tulasnella sp. 331]|nr:hypothetical protein FRB97_006442 [Tulasnella sp. 331]